MKIKSSAGISSLVVTAALLITPLSAGPIQERAENQRHRIVQGVRTGELTARETVKIVANEVKLQAQARNMREDGLTARERVRVNQKQNQLSRQISQQKHDGQSQRR